MEWMPVYGSSHVVAIRYHEPSRECFVQFKNGAVYVYEDVTPELWEELVHAPSKGVTVNRVMARGHKYRRVDETEKKDGD